MINKISAKHILGFLFLASATALVLAYISQYIFGLQPCELCFWQRKPFFAIIAISALFLIIPFFKKNKKIGIYINIFLLIINAAIAFYHSGVERKIFAGLDSCSSFLDEANSIDELERILLQTKAVRCDEPQFIFLHLSMAEWNFVYCFVLVVLSIIFLRKSLARSD